MSLQALMGSSLVSSAGDVLMLGCIAIATALGLQGAVIPPCNVYCLLLAPASHWLQSLQLAVTDS